MLLAVTYDYDSKQVGQHFGHTENFLMVEVKDGKKTLETVINNGGYSHQGLVTYLADLGIEVLICGGLGNNAYNLLSNANIKVIPGVNGGAKEAVDRYLKGELDANMNVLHDCDCGHHH